MSETLGGFIGIAIGIVLVLGVQITCYKFFNEMDYPKAVVIALSSTIVGILIILTLMQITT